MNEEHGPALCPLGLHDRREPRHAALPLLLGHLVDVVGEQEGDLSFLRGRERSAREERQRCGSEAEGARGEAHSHSPGGFSIPRLLTMRVRPRRRESSLLAAV